MQDRGQDNTCDRAPPACTCRTRGGGGEKHATLSLSRYSNVSTRTSVFKKRGQRHAAAKGVDREIGLSRGALHPSSPLILSPFAPIVLNQPIAPSSLLLRSFFPAPCAMHAGLPCAMLRPSSSRRLAHCLLCTRVYCHVLPPLCAVSFPAPFSLILPRPPLSPPYVFSFPLAPLIIPSPPRALVLASSSLLVEDKCFLLCALVIRCCLL
ncbi:hypothetical protein DFH06DRAFT_243367 [Mycena polygramma]|nr:hypothetical protein DFH06DRAFT_243367 [Mycena polygramma]